MAFRDVTGSSPKQSRRVYGAAPSARRPFGQRQHTSGEIGLAFLREQMRASVTSPPVLSLRIATHSVHETNPGARAERAFTVVEIGFEMRHAATWLSRRVPRVYSGDGLHRLGT